METLGKDLKAIVKTLRDLAKKAETIAKQLERIPEAGEGSEGRKEAGSSRRAAKVTSRGGKGPTANEIVLGIIKRSKKGVDMATLKKKTGFEGRRTYDAVHRLKKQGKIKRNQDGLYVLA